MTARFDPTAYGPHVAALLTPERLPELGPGTPNRTAQPLFQQLTVERLFEGRSIRDRDMARCCLSALWLHHDFLDESHTISQEISTTSGSYWHAIMHRREPDAWNSKYWFRRVGSHPVLDQLAAEAPALGYDFRGGAAFVDFCERARGGADEDLARCVQLLEWQLLFDYCYRAALA